MGSKKFDDEELKKLHLPRDDIDLPSTPQEHANLLWHALCGLEDRVLAAQETPDKRSVPYRVLALIADTQSLAKGISTGAISISQPRMAANMVELATALDENGYQEVASVPITYLEWMSLMGLAAENCSLGRQRIGPSKS